MTLIDYLNDAVRRAYKPGDWDCSVFALGWIAESAPQTASKVAKLLIAAGYNEISDETGFAKVRAKMGVASPEELAVYFHSRLPDNVLLPSAHRPGDIVFRPEGLAAGIVDEDYQVVYLAKPKGFAKQSLRAGDACVRARD